MVIVYSPELDESLLDLLDRDGPVEEWSPRFLFLTEGDVEFTPEDTSNNQMRATLTTVMMIMMVMVIT